MATARVYHAKREVFPAAIMGDWSSILFPGHYDLVAEVEIPDGKSPEDWAYERTNTVDEYWWSNTGVVRRFAGEGCRSTSVGDVVERPDGVLKICASVGWVTIQADEKERHVADKEKTYLVSIWCANCHKYRTYAVPVGTTVKQWVGFTSTTCSVCGCNTLSYANVAEVPDVGEEAGK